MFQMISAIHCIVLIVTSKISPGELFMQLPCPPWMFHDTLTAPSLRTNLAPSLFASCISLRRQCEVCTAPHNLPWNGTPLSSGEWHKLLTNPVPGPRRGRLKGSVSTNQGPGEMSKLRCGAARRILPRAPPGLGAWQSSCTAGSAEAEKGLVIRGYKSVGQSTSLLRRPPPLFLVSVRDAAAYSCSDLLKSNKEKDIVFLQKTFFRLFSLFLRLFFVPLFV